MRLTRDFFARPTLEVARQLVGMVLVGGCGGEQAAGRIVEAEAYLGEDDPASHAAGGVTPRSAVMFGPAGRAYVYFIYGMHHCLNVVTEPEGRAGAVLIRALEPVAGQTVMAGRRGRIPPRQLCNGPGKLCQALGIDLAYNGISFLAGSKRGPWLRLRPGRAPGRLAITARIGIRKAARRPYRFVDAESPCLSVPLKRSPGPI
jgi:DNA-3-methyladenine glycosylase